MRVQCSCPCPKRQPSVPASYPCCLTKKNHKFLKAFCGTCLGISSLPSALVCTQLLILDFGSHLQPLLSCLDLGKNWNLSTVSQVFCSGHAGEKSHSFRFLEGNSVLWVTATWKRGRAALIKTAEHSLYASVSGGKDAGTTKTEKGLKALVRLLIIIISG